MKTLRALLSKLKYIFTKPHSIDVEYEVVKHIDNYENTGKTYVMLRVCQTRAVFYRPVEEVYQKPMLNRLSREDVAQIAVWYYYEKTGDTATKDLFPRRKKLLTRNVLFLGIIFVSCLNLSNLSAIKIVPIHLFHLNLTVPAALAFFPLTYFFDDILTEVYGFYISRLIIWAGLVGNAIVILGLYWTVFFPHAEFWHLQGAYAEIYGNTPRILLASFLGYLVGEFTNSALLSKIKVLTQGKHLYFRVLLSTCVGVVIDSHLFCFIAFYKLIPTPIIYTMVLTQIVIKMVWEVLALPVTYRLTHWLKRKDQVDYYDYGVKYNPFSLRVDND